MKKSIFIAISAIIVLAVGVFLIACSPKSSSLSPNEDAMLVEPTQQSKETSAEEWETFYAAVEELNATFFPNHQCVSYSLANDTIEDTQELKKKIVYADIDGALEGAGLGATVGGEIAESLGATIGTIVGAVVVGAYESYKAYDLSKSEATITTRPLNTLTQVNDTSIGVEIGMKHNILIDRLIKSNVSFENLSYRQAINLIINRYETAFSPIDSRLKDVLLGDIDVFVPTINNNVVQANQNFKQSATNLSTDYLHSYTTAYLQIVNQSIPNEIDKMYMSTYACQLYYSTALWIVR